MEFMVRHSKLLTQLNILVLLSTPNWNPHWHDLQKVKWHTMFPGPQLMGPVVIILQKQHTKHMQDQWSNIYIYMHKLSGIPTQTIINKLEQVQQYVACYILVTCNSSINDMLTRSPVADLGRACRQTQLIMMFKMFKQQVDINPTAYLQLLQSDTSHFIPECSCPACTNSFFRHTTWDWNTLAIDPLLCHTAGSEVIWLPTNVSAFLFLEMWCTQPLCTSPLCEAQSTEDDDCNSFTYTT